MVFAIGAAMAALSVASAVSSNKAIAKTANENAQATAKMLLQQYDVSKNNLLQSATEVNNQVGMELTELAFSKLRAEGSATTAIAEKGLAGNTALRAMQDIGMKAELSADSIVQAADSKLIDIQNQLRSAKYSYESGSMQNLISYNNAMSQQQSGLSIAANAISTGLSTASAVKGFMGSSSSTAVKGVN